MCATPSSGRYSIVTSAAGSSRARSTRSLPGTTTELSPSTLAASVVRSESSMSVAASSSPSSVGRRSTPERTWTDPVMKQPGPTGTGASVDRSHRSSGLLDPCCEVLNEVVHRSILRDQTCDLTRGVDHGGVVAASELLADLG